MEELRRHTSPKTLFQPGFFGPVRTVNRVVMAPMATNLAGCNGEVTDELIAYYCARSKGGVGTIIVENCSVEYPRGSNGAVQLRIDRQGLLIERGGTVGHVAADLYIAATPRRPDADSLTPFLEPRCGRLFAIGDSVKVGTIMDAVHDGFHAALRLSD